ncbi:MAG TPA: DUF5788 family protein [Thermoplasmata archaeon]|nr:DUF5788 family protein [Thermoplasmata archaeon]
MTTDMSHLLTDEERQKLISTIHSMVYWVGVLVPEYEMLENHKVELRDIVYRLVTKEHLTDEDKAKMEALITSLKKKEHDLEHTLSHDPMTVQAGKALMAEISGLFKAIDQLRSAESEDDADIGKKDAMSRIDDARRWHTFIKDIKPPK